MEYTDIQMYSARHITWVIVVLISEIIVATMRSEVTVAQQCFKSEPDSHCCQTCSNSGTSLPIWRQKYITTMGS
jgi:hypothetical protein